MLLKIIYLVKGKTRVIFASKIIKVAYNIEYTLVQVPPSVTDVQDIIPMNVTSIISSKLLTDSVTLVSSFYGSFELIFADILFVDVIKNHVYFNMKDGKKREFIMSLIAVQDMLPDIFCMAGRSCLVNVLEIREIDETRDGSVTLSDTTVIKLGRTYLEGIITRLDSL